MSRKRTPQVCSAVIEQREDHTLFEIEWFSAHPHVRMRTRPRSKARNSNLNVYAHLTAASRLCSVFRRDERIYLMTGAHNG
jgi:hypothetical protein